MCESSDLRQVSLYQKFTHFCKDVRRLIDSQTKTSFMELNVQHIVDQLLLILDSVADDFSDVSPVTLDRVSCFSQLIYQDMAVHGEFHFFENWIGLILCLLNLAMKRLVSVSAVRQILTHFQDVSPNILVQSRKLIIEQAAVLEPAQASTAPADRVEKIVVGPSKLMEPVIVQPSAGDLIERVGQLQKIVAALPTSDTTAAPTIVRNPLMSNDAVSEEQSSLRQRATEWRSKKCDDGSTGLHNQQKDRCSCTEASKDVEPPAIDLQSISVFLERQRSPTRQSSSAHIKRLTRTQALIKVNRWKNDKSSS